jgi:hypothetical protein
MANEPTGPPRATFATADAVGVSLGLVVFAVGVVMLIGVFRLSSDLFDSIDEEIGRARAPAPATANPGQEPAKPAQPAPTEGPTLAQVGAAIGLKLAVLLVMGYAGSLVATKGAQLLAAHRARPTIQ